MVNTRLLFTVSIFLLVAAAAHAQTPQPQATQQATLAQRPDSTRKALHIICSNTLTPSNEPLYVVNGLPVTREQFSALNPDEIKKISVLKDAQAVALYGARAANGAILVTLKKATKSQ